MNPFIKEVKMILDEDNFLTYKLKDGTEAGHCKYRMRYHNNHKGVFVEYINVDHEYRRQGIGEELLYYLYKKYGPVYGEFVTAGGVALLNKFLRDYVYKQ